ncbi:MAG: hypothetical protein MUE90_04955 [Thermoanaerobaculales bacterium]|nr:hypothetical protein [Thermoanaerobaculales bacterium]
MTGARRPTASPARGRELARRGLVAALAALLAMTAAAPAASQTVIDEVEELDWDRPEAWAMKYYNSVSLLTGLGPPRAREPWTFELGLELDSLPQLSEEQRRVGFGGTKVEDINRVPLFVRPRLTMGLPARWSLDLSYVPPVEVEGVRSQLLALALERPVLGSGGWVLGIRVFGQTGRVEGDFTCSEADASYPPGSPDNLYGCEAPSNDSLSLDHLGVALTGGVEVGATDVHAGLAATYMDMEFQVDARTAGATDRSLLLADGWTWSATAGASWALGGRTALGVELFYSPLSVRRPPAAEAVNDPLVNLRTLLRIGL